MHHKVDCSAWGCKCKEKHNKKEEIAQTRKEIAATYTKLPPRPFTRE